MQKKTCIIIPCYNEELRIDIQYIIYFLTISENIEILFVNDGSTDNTKEVLKKIIQKFPHKTFLLDQEINRGKGLSIFLGLKHCLLLNKYDFVGYFDADLASPLTEIYSLLKPFIDNKNTILTMGARVKLLGHNIKRNWTRHFLGRIFATTVSYLFKIPVYDSQCGAKLFKIEILDKILVSPFSTKWLFDLEIILRLRNHYNLMNYNNNIIMEVPLKTWEEKSKSKLKISDFFSIPFQIIKIYLRYNRLN